MDDEEVEETVNDLILQKITDFEKRLFDIEQGKLGLYAPTDPEEQRRFWVMEQYGTPDYQIDINLEQIHKATEWLKTGKLPRRKKAGTNTDDKEDGGVVLQLVKNDKV